MMEKLLMSSKFFLVAAVLRSWIATHDQTTVWAFSHTIGYVSLNRLPIYPLRIRLEPFVPCQVRLNPDVASSKIATTCVKHNNVIGSTVLNSDSGEIRNFGDVGVDSFDDATARVCTRKSGRKIFPLISRFKDHLQGLRNWIRSVRLKTGKTILAALIVTILFANTIAYAATSGGRVGGGSFSRSSSTRPSMSRPSSSPSSSSSGKIYYPRARVRYSNAGSVNYLNRHHHSTSVNLIQVAGSRPSRASDLLLLTGAGTLIAFGLANGAYGRRNDDFDYGTTRGSESGGATVASITVSVNIPNRNDPDSILSRIRSIAEAANTNTNRGLRDLVTAVTIELTRQEATIDSASATAVHYRVLGQAEREFQVMSVKGQTKVDRLTVNRFGAENRGEPRRNDSNSSYDENSPTKAIVTLNVALSGNFVGREPVNISNRKDLLDLLTRIGSDVQLEGTDLLTAEILWSPEDPNERLSQEEVYSKYPELRTM